MLAVPRLEKLAHTTEERLVVIESTLRRRLSDDFLACPFDFDEWRIEGPRVNRDLGEVEMPELAIRFLVGGRDASEPCQHLYCFVKTIDDKLEFLWMVYLGTGKLFCHRKNAASKIRVLYLRRRPSRAEHGALSCIGGSQTYYVPKEDVLAG